jgi:hypothetical protein
MGKCQNNWAFLPIPKTSSGMAVMPGFVPAHPRTHPLPDISPKLRGFLPGHPGEGDRQMGECHNPNGVDA